MEFGGLKPCTSNSPDSSRKRNRKRKPAELGESDGLSGKKLKRISALAEAAAKIDPSHLADFFAKPVAAFVALAMVLRTKPDVLTTLLPMLRERIMFQGQDKLPASEGNPVLAKEATEIAIGSLTANADCFKQWDILYKENLEASVVLLKKLVDEWKDHSLKLISTPSDTLTLNRAMNSFRLKSCKVILGRLSSGSGYLKGITAVTAAGAVVAGAVAGAVATVVIGGATGMEYFQ
ncbi:unnamed protein product [Arabidopsis lyrata]|nr:unnamed protein product [Arabidopsis lyrata]